MEKQRKKLIIQSICSMNTEMLEVLLDESRTYEDTDKDTFIQKLRWSFFHFHSDESGYDTELMPYEGYCNHNECSNKGCKGISFVGNKSKCHIDLIFSEEDDDEGNEIFQCNGFKTFEQIEDNDKLFRIPIYIEDHERADFKPSLDFLIQQQKCQLASDELNHFEEIVELDIVETWREKHRELFESIDKNNRHPDFLHFRESFSTLSNVIAYSEFGPVAIRALIEYSAISQNDETNLLKWLAKYKKLGWIRISGEVNIEENLITALISTGYSTLHKCDTCIYLRINSENLKDLIELDSIFNTHYSVLRDKLEALYPELFRF